MKYKIAISGGKFVMISQEMKLCIIVPQD